MEFVKHLYDEREKSRYQILAGVLRSNIRKIYEQDPESNINSTLEFAGINLPIIKSDFEDPTELMKHPFLSSGYVSVFYSQTNLHDAKWRIAVNDPYGIVKFGLTGYQDSSIVFFRDRLDNEDLAETERTAGIGDLSRGIEILTGRMSELKYT